VTGKEEFQPKSISMNTIMVAAETSVLPPLGIDLNGTAQLKTTS